MLGRVPISLTGQETPLMTQPAFPFKAVIFDMDGVIVDTEKFYFDTLAGMFDAAGIDVPRESLCSAVGASFKDFKRNLVAWYALGGEQITEDEGLERYNAWESAHYPDFASLLNPGVVETVDELKRRGVRVALASSSPMGNIREVLAACGLADAFELVTSGEQFHQSKPNPEIYLHTLESLGLIADECCCVEDSVPGITAGKAAGLTVVAKREDRFGFSQEAADYTIDSIPDLLEVVMPLGR